MGIGDIRFDDRFIQLNLVSSSPKCPRSAHLDGWVPLRKAIDTNKALLGAVWNS